jgi:hypothetical protein
MPLTKQYLDSVQESRKDFQLRRIKWAVQELKRQGEFPKLWKVLRKAGIRKEYCKDMENFIFKIVKE